MWEDRRWELVLFFCYMGYSDQNEDIILSGKYFDLLSHLASLEIQLWPRIIQYLVINQKWKSRQFESEAIYPIHSTIWFIIKRYLTSFHQSFMKGSFAMQKKRENINIHEWCQQSWVVSTSSMLVIDPALNFILSLFIFIRWFNIH